VIVWEIVYFNFMPDFVDKYTAYMVGKMTASGASQQAINATIQQMKDMKRLFDNPLTNAAISIIEPFPIGLVITLISSAILRKKSPAVSQDSPSQSRSGDVLDQPSSF
jgi:hypothetical protein